MFEQCFESCQATKDVVLTLGTCDQDKLLDDGWVLLTLARLCQTLAISGTSLHPHFRIYVIPPAGDVNQPETNPDQDQNVIWRDAQTSHESNHQILETSLLNNTHEFIYN